MSFYRSLIIAGFVALSANSAFMAASYAADGKEEERIRDEYFHQPYGNGTMHEVPAIHEGRAATQWAPLRTLGHGHPYYRPMPNEPAPSGSFARPN